ncbi:MAG TPA: SDR family oxidoreductase [Candidatus Eisenbacteria bacterium]|nr:SDR family oxidoreductase [Candidatus Eisenbacteria bacterium]
MIVVTGATGKTGSEVVRLLTARGIRVRALVRDPEKAKTIKGPGLEVAIGDLEKPGTLDPAFKGADRIFLVSSPDPHVGDLHGNAIEAAKRSGVKQIVRLSAYAASPQSSARLLRTHGEVDEHLSRSGLSFTILRPQSFFQNFLYAARPIVSQGKFFATVKDGPIGLMDVRDVALAAASVLTTDTHSGRIYEMTGPEALTYKACAERLSEATGRTIEYVDVPPDAARAGMLAIGLPEWIADGLLELHAITASGKAAGVSDAFERITQKKPRGFDVFARDFATVFGGQPAEAKAAV